MTERSKYQNELLYVLVNILEEGDTSMIHNEEALKQFASFQIHNMSHCVTNIGREIEENLTNMNTESRFSYLNRYQKLIDAAINSTNRRVELLIDSTGEEQPFAPTKSVKPIYVNKRILIGYNKTAIAYLKIVNYLINEKRGSEKNHGVKNLDWVEYVVPELAPRLLQIENKIKDKIENWSFGNDKIECASFCELLYDKKYFNRSLNPTRIKTSTEFAASKYGIEIKNQLLAAKKKDRETHKKLLSKFFN